MEFFNVFEPFLRPFNEAQKMFFNTWETTLDNMQNTNLLNIPENVEKTLQLQEELVINSLDLQEQLSKFSIDTQNKIWESYFKIVRRV